MKSKITKVMSKKLVVVPMGTCLMEAQKIMTEKRIRHLPVVDEMDDVVGILSQRDLANGTSSLKIPVELLMSSPLHYVPWDLPLKSAILKMLELKISSLLVADEDENAIGIVTTDDLLWHLSNLLSDETEEKTLLSPSSRKFIGEFSNKLAQMGI